MSLTRLVLVLALAGASSSCMLMPQGRSAVAEGRYFSTGNAAYDEFFVRLHRMQVELKTAPETLASIRQAIARGVELPPTADTQALRAALTTKANEMGRRGANLSVDHGREPGAHSRLKVTGTPPEADRPLVKELEDVLARLGEVRDRSVSWQKELEWLPPTGVALDGSVEAAFVGRSKWTRDEVHQNLADAQKVVALMPTRIKEIDQQGDEIEELFVGAFGETKAEPPPPEPPKSKPRPAPRPRANEAPPSPAQASSETAPSAPKPKHGTAKPDFEP
jgi:hypothetical protein